MNFFADTMFNKKGIRDIYSIYLAEAKKLHFDDLASIQIVYVIRGNVNIFLDGKNQTFTKGELFILNIFENKFMYPSDDNLLLITKISGDYVKSIGEEYYISRFENRIDRKLKNEFLYNILNLYKTSQNIGNEKLNISIIHEIVKFLLINCINPRKTFTNIENKSYYLKRMEDYIYENEVKDTNLNNIARSMHVSASYLSKIFSELSGINFSEYIQQIKLYYSIIYILNTKSTLEIIAEEIGFESIKSLNRIFNKYFNMPPSLFRRKYCKFEKKYLEESDEFIELFNEYKIINYGEFVNKNCSKNINNFEIDISQESNYTTFENWKIIKNLKSLGLDYLETLDAILKQFNIREIILRFRYEKEKLYLVDLNREVHYYELNELLNKCIEYDVRLVIGLKFDDFENCEITDEILQRKKELCNMFFESLARAVGITNMKRFTYLVDISKVTDYLDNKELFEKYITTIYDQEELLKNIAGEDFYNWGFEVGDMTVERLDEINKVADIFKNKNFTNKPKVLSMTYKDNYIENITDIKDLNKIRQRLHDNRTKLTKIVEKFSFDISRVYINDLFYNIDISEINYLYSDLLIVSILLESLYEADKDVNYITDYRVRDRNKIDEIYYPIYKDKSGFFTPLFWISLLLDSIEGE